VISLAHVGGFPLEEMLPALAGMGASVAGVRVWLAVSLRRDRDEHDG
jgi:hypothetical protein